MKYTISFKNLIVRTTIILFLTYRFILMENSTTFDFLQLKEKIKSLYFLVLKFEPLKLFILNIVYSNFYKNFSKKTHLSN